LHYSNPHLIVVQLHYSGFMPFYYPKAVQAKTERIVYSDQFLKSISKKTGMKPIKCKELHLWIYNHGSKRLDNIRSIFSCL